jgi:DUF438 domain-containing protein
MVRFAPALSPPARRRFDVLPAGHPIAVFVEEHERILGFVDRLDDLIEQFRDDVGTPRARDVALEIAGIARDLLDAKPHHDREEAVLFAALERRGVALPPRVMRMEHRELHALEVRLAAAVVVEHPDSEEIAEAGGSLSSHLRDHIAKENEILYPMALDVLNDPHVWESMNPPLREIGPCRWSADLFR